MRALLTILGLLLALPANGEVFGKAEDFIKDAIRKEMHRKMPIPTPTMVFDMPPEIHAISPSPWRLSFRVGPVLYKDDDLADRNYGRFQFRVRGSLTNLRVEKDLLISIQKTF